MNMDMVVNSIPAIKDKIVVKNSTSRPSINAAASRRPKPTTVMVLLVVEFGSVFIVFSFA